MVPASTAGASHTPPGPGGCAQHTLTCWPGCGWEWAGVQEVTAAPCEMPVKAWVSGSDGGSVAAHLTTTVTVAGTVTADRGAGWPDSGTTPASDVRIINTSSDPVPAEAMNASLSEESLNLLGFVVGVGAASVFGTVLFRRNMAKGRGRA